MLLSISREKIKISYYFGHYHYNYKFTKSKIFYNFIISICIKLEFVAFSQQFHQFICVWNERGLRYWLINVIAFEIEGLFWDHNVVIWRFTYSQAKTLRQWFMTNLRLSKDFRGTLDG